MDTAALVYATFPDKACAERIATTLLEERLIACANLLGGVTSLYRWEGAITASSEWAMLAKTQQHRVQDCIRRIGEQHPYQCPAIIALPIAAGDGTFLSWVASETDDNTASTNAAIQGLNITGN